MFKISSPPLERASIWYQNPYSPHHPKLTKMPKQCVYYFETWTSQILTGTSFCTIVRLPDDGR